MSWISRLSTPEQSNLICEALICVSPHFAADPQTIIIEPTETVPEYSYIREI